MQKKTKVLHVYRTYFPDTQGGLEEVIRQICINTQAQGIESRVLTLSPNPTPSELLRPEARVHRVKLDAEIASCGLSIRAFKKFKQLLEWAEVVHYHFPWPFADLLHFFSNVKQPTVVTYHSDIVRQKLLGRLYEPLMSRFLDDVNSIVCTSPNYFATSNVLPRFESKVQVIPIGLDEQTYPATEAKTQHRMEAKYGRDFFLFIGVLRYYKGLHILLDAIKDAPYNVVIAGSGPTERELMEQAKELGLTNVHFTGYVNDAIKIALIQLSRAIVFPSYLRAEAFGVTLLEGAMFSRPLISTEVGSGTSHVNIDGQTGIVVLPGSSSEIRKAMDQMHFRPEMASLMGRKARERFEQLFTGQLMGLRYAELYKKLTEETGVSEEELLTKAE